MISLARVSAQMGKHYYTSDSYYTKEGAVENSEWFGKGAKINGLEGHVDPKNFQNLLDEYATKQKSSPDKNVRAALDLTFSAPKSVSLAGLVCGDERILKAHNDAVNSALKFVEERYSLTRTGSKENREVEVTGNILAAKFTHDVSREKDPQLHTHCVVFNKVKRADGQWRSLHNDGIFNNSKLIGLVYQNELAHKIKGLGYEILINKNGTFEIEGYSKEQIQEFSKRTQKIKELNCKTKKQERVEKLLDRPSKGKAIPRDVLLEKWKETENLIGIEHPEPNLKPHKKSRDNPNCQYEESIKNNISDALNHVTERDVRFKKEELEKFILTHNLGKESFDTKKYSEKFNDMITNHELIEYKKGHFTTKDCLNTESSIIEKITTGKSKFNSIVNVVPEHILKNSLGLKKGQQEALINTLKSQDQFTAWQGVAGAGKTFAMNFLREECEKQGVTIKGFSPQKQAAAVLQSESKIESNTIASLFVEKDPFHKGHKNLSKNQVWIVDEAGLLGAKDCEKLIQKAINENARIVFVGDTKQMPSIQAGNPFKLIQDKGVKTSHLNESIRQNKAPENFKEAVNLISQHKIKEGLSKIENKILEISDPKNRSEFIKNEYLKLKPEEQNKSLILCSTNEEKNLLTNEIRKDLFKKHLLKDEVTLNQLLPKNLTTQEMKSSLSHNTNDVFVFHKNFKAIGIQKDHQYFVKNVDIKNNEITLLRKDLSSQSHEIKINPKIGGFTTYEQKQLSFAVGDKIRATKNDRLMGTSNGQEFFVTKTNENSVTLKSKSGHELHFDSKKPVHLDHNYVNTVYSSQGKTCDRVFISGNKSFGREMLYVALSRAKFDAVVVTQNKNEFMKASEIQKTKVSAVELVPASKMNINHHTQNYNFKSTTKMRL